MKTRRHVRLLRSQALRAGFFAGLAAPTLLFSPLQAKPHRAGIEGAWAAVGKHLTDAVTVEGKRIEQEKASTAKRRAAK